MPAFDYQNDCGPLGFSAWCFTAQTMSGRAGNIMAMKDLKSLLRQKIVSSLELVELLNALRDESEPRLRHDHFVRKVAQVLGNEASKKFMVKPPVGRGRTRMVYLFPKREACLMVMSYGYKLQAMMFDMHFFGGADDVH